MNIYKQLLNYPEDCIKDSKIHKTIIYETGNLKTRDKNIIQQNIEQITWKYSFKPNNTNIPPYIDENREYYEVEIVEILLRKQEKTNRIADILFRTMPHPSLLFFRFNEQMNIYAAHVRLHGSDYSIFTYEDEDNKYIKTGWINLKNKTETTQKLYQDLKLENLNNENFYKLYDNIYNTIINYKSDTIKKGKSTSTPEEKKKILKKIDNLENNIKELKTLIKKDVNFNEIIEINTQINKYETEKQKLIRKL